MNAIRSEGHLVSSFGLLIAEGKTLIDDLYNVSVIFVKQSAIRIAHHVARHRLFAGCIDEGNVSVELLRLANSLSY